MPVPTLTKLPPKPEFSDIINKINSLVQELTNLLLNLDTLNIVELNAQVITAESITGDKIQANTITADKMQVNELSAITANLGHITAGIIESIQLFSSFISTSQNTYPRVEISPTTNQVKVYTDPLNYLLVSPGLTGVPEIEFYQAGELAGALRIVFGAPVLISQTSLLLACGDQPGDRIEVNSWDQLHSRYGLESLQDALDKKADKSAYTGSFNVGTQTVNVVNGIIVSVV